MFGNISLKNLHKIILMMKVETKVLMFLKIPKHVEPLPGVLVVFGLGWGEEGLVCGGSFTDAAVGVPDGRGNDARPVVVTL